MTGDKKCTCAIAAVALCVGCATPRKVLFTARDDWRTRRLEHVGVSVKLPHDRWTTRPRFSKGKEHLGHAGVVRYVTMRLDPYYSGSWANGYEYASMLDISRVESRLVAAYFSRSFDVNTPLYTNLVTKVKAGSRVSLIPNHDKYLEFQKDEFLPNGDLLRCGGFFHLETGDSNAIASARSDVRRILDSLQPLDEPYPPKEPKWRKWPLMIWIFGE